VIELVSYIVTATGTGISGRESKFIFSNLEFQLDVCTKYGGLDNLTTVFF
jgi:hypothetical protein